MKAKIESGFAIGKLSGLTWNDIEGYAAEVSGEDNNAVYYRGKFICHAFNNEFGGEITDIDDKHMTETQVQDAINKIDLNRER